MTATPTPPAPRDLKVYPEGEKEGKIGRWHHSRPTGFYREMRVGARAKFT
jgi:hypothetical protein